MSNIDFKMLPKVNLHHHMEGAMRAETFMELGIKNGFLDSYTKIEEVRAMLQINGSEKNLKSYLDKVDITIQVISRKSDLTRLVKEIIEDSYNDGVKYLELRGGPTLHIKEGLPIEAVFEGILEGISEGEKATGIKARFIATALRHEKPIKNEALARLAGKYKKYGVVGFDLAGDEALYPARYHRRSFEIAREEGLGITVHAGEAAGFESILDAIELLGASRIGHGIFSIFSEDTLSILKEKKILLEVCPTSNVHTKAVEGYQNHPIRKLFDKGILISVGDDDPTTSNIDLTHEFMILKNKFNFSLDEIRELQYNGIDNAFISEAEKEKIKCLL